TTLAPWGLAFIQSYAVDKRLRPSDLAFERVDVIAGAVMTGVIGFFIVIACAATLHASGRSINDAGDAAAALQPLAGSFASTLFGVGLLGAALLAAAILPLSTAYSVSEALGREARVEASIREEPVFYGTYALVVGVGALVVLVPGAPLVPILFITQAINASGAAGTTTTGRAEEHTCELQSRGHHECRLLLDNENTILVPPR